MWRIYHYTSLVDAAAEADDVHRRTVMELLGAIAADPAKLIPVARLAGITATLLSEVGEDALAIWTALDSAVNRADGKAHLAEGVEFLLRHCGRWDGATPAGDESELWGPAKLAVLLDSAPACPAHVKHLAGRAVDQRNRADLAADHFVYAKLLLIDPAVPIGDSIPVTAKDAIARQRRTVEAA